MTTKQQKYFIYMKEPTHHIDGLDFIHINDIETLKTTSVDYVYIHDLLDYIDEEACEKTIKLIKSRLKRNGTFIIQGTDIKALSTSLLYGQIELSTFKLMAYGLGKKTSYPVSDMKSIISNIDGLKIMKVQFINGSQYYIECMKHE